MERVFTHKQEFSTEEFHAMCEEAPKNLINGEKVHSAHLITEWLIEVHGFGLVPYRATFQAYTKED